MTSCTLIAKANVVNDPDKRVPVGIRNYLAEFGKPEKLLGINVLVVRQKLFMTWRDWEMQLPGIGPGRTSPKYDEGLPKNCQSMNDWIHRYAGNRMAFVYGAPEESCPCADDD